MKSQPHLKQKEDDLIKLYEKQTELTAEVAQLCTQNVSKTPSSTKVNSAAKESEYFAKRAKGVRAVRNSMGAPSNATYLALLSEHDESKNRFEALLFDNQLIPGWPKCRNSCVPGRQTSKK